MRKILTTFAILFAILVQPIVPLLTVNAAAYPVSFPIDFDEDNIEVEPIDPPVLTIEWIISQDGSYTTGSEVELNKTYIFPENEDVTIVFTSLPAQPGTITIKEITLSSEQVEATNARSNIVYEITSTMTNGTFTYDLTLPTNGVEDNVEVYFAEDLSSIDEAEKIDEGVSVDGDVISITGLDHFTIFIVSDPVLTSTACTVAGASSDSDCYNTIQEAVDAASAGDTIIVDSTYDSSNETFPITIDKQLFLYGAQQDVDPRGGRVGDETVIDADGSAAIVATAGGIVINGFKFINGGGGGSTKMIRFNLGGVGTQFVYNIVDGAAADDAVKVYNCTANCLVSYNYINDTNEDAIGIVDSVGVEVSYNLITNNSSSNAAIYVYGSENMLITENEVDTVTVNDGIKLGSKNGADSDLSGGTISFNTVNNTAQDCITVYTSDTVVDHNSLNNCSSENGSLYVSFNVNNVDVICNVISESSTTYGVRIGKSSLLPTDVVVNYNVFDLSAGGLFYNTTEANAIMDAQFNYWGDSTGPVDLIDTDNSNPLTNIGGGNGVVGAVNYTSFLDSADIPQCDTTGDISGYKWEDINANSEWDDDEAGLEGWTIELWSYENGALGSVVATTTTDSDGYYEFIDIDSGAYFIKETIQDDWVQTYPYDGLFTEETQLVIFNFDFFDSLHLIKLGGGDTSEDNNFGNFELAAIEGLKYFDRDYDGDFGDVEQNFPDDAFRIDDWEIYLYRLTDFWQLVGTMDTGDDTTEVGEVEKGQYRFSGLFPGSYVVCEEDRTADGWVQTEPTASTGVEDTFTSGDNGNGPFTGLYCHPVEIEQVGNALESGTIFEERDFGNYTLPQLDLDKSDSDDAVQPGETIVYTLDYANLANFPVINTWLSDVVPVGTTFNLAATTAAGTTGWSCADGAPAGTECILVVGSLAAGETGTAYFAVTVDDNIDDSIIEILNEAEFFDPNDVENTLVTSDEPTPVASVLGATLVSTGVDISTNYLVSVLLVLAVLVVGGARPSYSLLSRFRR